jgi:menaquinone-dependent protoporphyrinogen oxidase
MTVLVAYGTTNGSTAEIAGWIGAELRAAGLTVDIRSAAEVRDVDRYAAVILGGALYVLGWHPHARQFAHRFAGALAHRPVWLFSSGPLDESAECAELAPIPQVESVLRAVHARGHVTFGGRRSPGMVAYRTDHDGDFRNPRQVRAWARRVAREIEAATVAAAHHPAWMQR